MLSRASHSLASEINPVQPHHIYSVDQNNMQVETYFQTVLLLQTEMLMSPNTAIAVGINTKT